MWAKIITHVDSPKSQTHPAPSCVLSAFIMLMLQRRVACFGMNLCGLCNKVWHHCYLHTCLVLTAVLYIYTCESVLSVFA